MERIRKEAVDSCLEALKKRTYVKMAGLRAEIGVQKYRVLWSKSVVVNGTICVDVVRATFSSRMFGKQLHLLS
jgi:hypothetical protein